MFAKAFSNLGWAYNELGEFLNAIKYYRQEMDEKFGEQVGLREAKEYIDGIASDMKRRGI